MKTFRAMRAALEMGVRHVDTAEMYGDGHAEEAAAARPSKGFDRQASSSSHPRRSPITWAASSSLRRRKVRCAGSTTDYLDLYMVHHPNDAIPIAETMAAMDAVGATRYWCATSA
jgi:myo-inositol catabolism protein IolS